MTILIIAGGQNSRFSPLNSSTHKGFITLCGKPLLIRQLENLQEHGFKDIVLVVSLKDNEPDKFAQMLKDHNLLGINLTLIVQPEAKGMGDAVLLAKNHLSDQFAVTAPYHPTAGAILSQMIQELDKNKPDAACVAATPTKEPWMYGMLRLQADQAIGIVEKPEQGTEHSDLKVQSMYLLNQHFIQILSQLPPAEYNFETALNQLMTQDHVQVHRLVRSLPSLKFPWQLFEVQNLIFSGMQTQISSQATISPTAVLDKSTGPIVVEAGATIGHCARIVGPSYIGKDCLVGDFTLLRQSTMEQGSKIGSHADITRSIFLENATFHGAGFIGDSIIGTGTKIGAGLITANKRLDRQTIKTIVKDVKVDTGLNSLGTVIGQEVKIGIRVSTMPGILIGARQTIPPGEIVKRNIDTINLSLAT